MIQIKKRDYETFRNELNAAVSELAEMYAASPSAGLWSVRAHAAEAIRILENTVIITEEEENENGRKN